MEVSRLIEVSKDGDSAHKEKFAMDVLMGLCSTPKNISPKYFYDDIGSELFQLSLIHI